jgi:hypothetical protein
MQAHVESLRAILDEDVPQGGEVDDTGKPRR